MGDATVLSRSFGREAADLELDFDHADRPALVTALLAACARPADAEHWWQQPVGARTAALLALLGNGEEAAMRITLPCSAAGCGTRFEVDLPHSAFAAAPVAHGPVCVERDRASPLTLRLPTGNDLRAWRQLAPTGRTAAQAAMLVQLCIGGEPRPEDAARAADALAEADPLVAFSIFCACPTCGDEAERELDLEGLALSDLAAQQRGLLREVHALASRYGWTEDQILALTPGRRARYLALIEGEA